MKRKLPCPRCDGTGKLFDDRELGAALRAEREKAGKSLREVAKKMDLTISYISDLELGRRMWREELIERFRGALR